MFGNKKQQTPPPQWLPQLQETKERWFAFLDKLEIKLQEFCESVIPALQEQVNETENFDEWGYDRVKAGVLGQLENIRQKAYNTYEEKVTVLYDTLREDISVMSPHYQLLANFRNECSERYHNNFNYKYNSWQDAVKAIVPVKDNEAKYQSILNDYEKIKHSFSCTQCGGGITIDKIFFISAYITCPFCQTQNTFEPGSQARELEFLGRELAEERTASLLQEHFTVSEKSEELLHQIRQTRSDIKFESNMHAKDALQQQLQQLEKSYKEANKVSVEKYEYYLRKMFDEWNSIVPGLAAQNDKFYERMLQDFRRTV